MKDLTDEQELAHRQATVCHICDKEILSQQLLSEYDASLEKMKKDKTLGWKRRSPENLGPKGE